MQENELRFRQIHMDYHTTQHIADVAGRFDPDEVARTPGICLQHFNADPSCPRLSDVLAGPSAARDNLLAASRQTPIFPDQILYDELDSYRPHLNEGRFALEITCPADKIDSVLKEFKP